MDNIKIGLFLQALRKAKGYTQQELADYLNLSNKTISKWECGQGIPDVSTLIVLAEFYEVSVDEILNGQIKEVKESKSTKLRDEYIKNKVYRKYLFFNFISIALACLVIIFNIFIMCNIFVKAFVISNSILISISLVFAILPYVVYGNDNDLKLKSEEFEKKYDLLKKILFSVLGFTLTFFFNNIFYSLGMATNIVNILISLILAIIVFLVDLKNASLFLIFSKISSIVIVILFIYFNIINSFVPALYKLDNGAFENVYLYNNTFYSCILISVSLIGFLSILILTHKNIVISSLSIIFGVALLALAVKLNNSYTDLIYYNGIIAYPILFIIIGGTSLFFSVLSRKDAFNCLKWYETNRKGKLLFFILSPILIISSALYFYFIDAIKVYYGGNAYFNMFLSFKSQLLIMFIFIGIGIVVFLLYFVKKYRTILFEVINIGVLIAYIVIFLDDSIYLSQIYNTWVSLDYAFSYFLLIAELLIIFLWPIIYIRLKMNKKLNNIT